MNVEELLDKGFDMRQASQILFIDELGINLKDIDITTPVENLKNFKNKLKRNEIPNECINEIKNITKNNGNITNLLDYDEIGYKQLEKLCDLTWFTSFNYDISRIAKEDYPDKYIKELKNIYYELDEQFELLEDPNINYYTLKTMCDYLEPDYKLKYYLHKATDFNQITALLNVYQSLKLIDKKPDKLPDLSLIFDSQYNPKQAEQIMDGLIRNVDIRNYCDNTFNYEQMRSIKQGLLDKVDVSFFNKKRYTSEQMDMIEFYLDEIKYENCDFDINLICDCKYSPDMMNFLAKELSEGKDISIYTENNYDINQCNVLKMVIDNDLDVSAFNDVNLDWKNMFVLYKALSFKNNDIDINYIKSNDTVKNKIDYLIKFTDISKIKDINPLEIKLLDNSEKLNDFYFYFNNIRETRIYETNDNKILVVEPLDDYDDPDLEYFDEIKCEDFEGTFVEEYEDEIRTFLDLITFYEFDEAGGHSFNLYTDSPAYQLNLEFDENLNFVLELIIEETIDALKYRNYDITYGSLFDDLEEFNECGVIDVRKMAWVHDFNSGEPNFIFEKDLKNKIDIDIKDELIFMYKKFMQESEKIFAASYDDVANIKLFDKDFNLLDESVLYGTMDIEEKISEMFNVNLVKEFDECEIDNISKKIEDIEK